MKYSIKFMEGVQKTHYLSLSLTKCLLIAAHFIEVNWCNSHSLPLLFEQTARVQYVPLCLTCEQQRYK